jgi:calcineurin-like phosphoesterase family protein
MSVWITADTHFGHRNIIKYCNRPYDNIEDHDKDILQNINDSAKTDDHLYILGDFCMGNPLKYLSQIKCRKLHFVLGSHDKQMWAHKDMFIEFKDKIITSINGITVVMTHCAHLVWEKSHYGSVHAFGHSHGNLGNSRETIFNNEYSRAVSLIISRAKMHDVGVDGHNFKPYSFEEFMSIVDKKSGFLIE